MNSNHSQLDEVRLLTDQLYDGEIDDAGMERIESLILQDQQCLQTYVERLDFHSELLEQADERSAETTALEILQQSAKTSARRETRFQWKAYGAIVACTLLVAAGMVWLHFSEALAPATLGTVASLSHDYTSLTAPLELGQVVRVGQKLEIKNGIVSLQLSGVVVDLIGPAKLRLDRRERVSLLHGTVVAKVQPDAIGFTVRTPEAEVVDLGTEFLVQHSQQTGSHVSVRRGAAQAKVIDWRGEPTKIIELTASRAAQFQQAASVSKEVAYSAEKFLPVDQSRGGIRRLTGALRTADSAPVSLLSDQTTTPNHMLVIPERTVVLDAPLTVEGLQGPVVIPAGAHVSSYLLHYDPTAAVSFAPRGAVTFFGSIAAIVGTSHGLATTDRQFGLQETQYEPGSFRELEMEEDEIQISDDRKTISFFFGVSPPEFLDELRVLVVESTL